jgi:trans-aconitate methyltransferase
MSKSCNKNILSIGCEIGTSEYTLAEYAKHIHILDANKDMIDYAQNKYKNINNLSLEHCCAEDLQSHNSYHLAIAPFAMHCWENKKQALQRINDALELHGELFCTVQTSNNRIPANLTVIKEMMDLPILTNANVQIATDNHYLSLEEYNTMLKETGFDVIKNESDSYLSILTKDDLTNQYFIFFTEPYLQSLSAKLKQDLFEEFITRYANKLKKVDNDTFLEICYTTIIHARKIQK